MMVMVVVVVVSAHPTAEVQHRLSHPPASTAALPELLSYLSTLRGAYDRLSRRFDDAVLENTRWMTQGGVRDSAAQPIVDAARSQLELTVERLQTVRAERDAAVADKARAEAALLDAKVVPRWWLLRVDDRVRRFPLLLSPHRHSASLARLHRLCSPSARSACTVRRVCASTDRPCVVLPLRDHCSLSVLVVLRRLFAS